MKTNLRRMLGILLCAVMIFALPAAARADAVQTRVSLGADLTDTQRNTVLAIFGLSAVPADAVFITNQEERTLLGDFVPSQQLGTKSLSCAMVTLRNDKNGITVTTHNITWCTSAMYISALATAGIENADVVVAAPTQVSGTAALAGIYKAYETAANVTLSEEAKSVAGEELAITGQLAEYLGTDEAVALIDQVKREVVEQGLDNEESIRPAIVQASKELGVQLTDAQIDMLVKLALRMLELDLDAKQIAEQAQGILKTLEGLQRAQESTAGFFDKVAKGFTAVVDWFKGLFSK